MVFQTCTISTIYIYYELCRLCPRPSSSSSSNSSRMCVKSWRRFAKSMRWTRPRRAPGSSFAPATTAPWSALVAGRLGSLIYMTLCDFICNMNLCCTIWLYLSLYDPITLLSLLYDFKWWYNVLHGRFNLETWNYLCIHIQSYFTDPQKRTLKWHGRGWRSHYFHRMKQNRLDPRRKAMVIAWVS